MPKNIIAEITTTRSPQNPLITFDSDPSLGNNINGPSVIRVPEWIKNPLGIFYMYFAHHSGDHIRLAYADDVHGPWQIHQGGCLHVDDSYPFIGHIASPDVHIDHQQQEIRMYFHGCADARSEQWNGVARSQDGLHFKVSSEILGKFYFRVFQFGNKHYAIAKNWNNGTGELYCSVDGLKYFESRGPFIEKMRHCALLRHQNSLLVFYSRVSDTPERIVVASINLDSDWHKWEASGSIDVLRPEGELEGCQYENTASTSGFAIEVQQLRDPCIFEDDGKVYLFYSYAGEMGISLAELGIQYH
ncbi:MAG: hypothetical protein HRU15_11360 [Planctomycetes bacterium]|nr:hypothetical protein [Planctomycetota bacterium]